MFGCLVVAWGDGQLENVNILFVVCEFLAVWDDMLGCHAKEM